MTTYQMDLMMLVEEYGALLCLQLLLLVGLHTLILKNTQKHQYLYTQKYFKKMTYRDEGLMVKYSHKAVNLINKELLNRNASGYCSL